MNSEALLEHSNFIRSLARSLVVDDSSADDLMQKTWLAAIKSPPREETHPVGWLSRVVKNLAKMEKRSSVRRYKREKTVAVPESVRSTEDVFERQAQTQLVFDAVMSLNDPYRSAILLRYYDELPPRKIASETGAPVTTVKTWLQRGQEQLRQKLDAEFGGDRKSWKLALAPLAGISLATSAASASTTATAAAVGTGVGAAALKVGLVGLVAAAALFFLTVIWDAAPPDGDRLITDINDPVVGRGGMIGSPDRGPARLRDRPTLDDEPSDRIPIRPQDGFISGLVTDRVTGEPVPEFDIVISPSGGLQNIPVLSVISESIKRGTGLFYLPFDGDPGRYDLIVKSPAHKARKVTITVPADRTVAGLDIELDPGLVVSGTVLDNVTGKPVAEAIVGVENATWLQGIRLEQPGSGIHDRSGEHGDFTVGGLRDGTVTLVADHPDYAQASRTVWTSSKGTMLRLERGPRVYGRALSANGEPLSGVLIEISGEGIVLPRVVVTGEDGRYITSPVITGSQVRVTARFPLTGNESEGKKAPDFFTEESRQIVIHENDQEVNFGLTENHVTWTGILVDEFLSPIGLGKILLCSARLPGFLRTACCDSEGRFEIPGLLRDIPYDVIVVFPGYRAQVPIEPVVLRPVGDMVVTRNIALSGGSIEGIVILRGSQVPAASGLIEAKSTSQQSTFGTIQAAVNHDGIFELRGLPPGTYELTYKYFCSAGTDTRTDREKIKTESGDYCYFEVVAGQVSRIAPIFVASKGELTVEGSGYGTDDDLEIRLIADEDSNGEKREFPLKLDRSISADGFLQYASMVPEGSWTAEISLDGQVVAERRITVHHSELTRLKIDRIELGAGALKTTLKGVLSWENGDPIEGAVISVQRINLSRDSQTLTCGTDSDGLFCIPGLLPGEWSVDALLGTDREYPLYRAIVSWIPVNVPNLNTPIIVRDLVVPPGKVVLRLSDRGRQQPISKDLDWRITAVLDGQSAAITHGIGSHVKLVGLPEGHIKFQIAAKGYRIFETREYLVSGGGILDLGEFELVKSE